MENVHIELLSVRYSRLFKVSDTSFFANFTFSLIEVINFWRAWKKFYSEFNHEFLNHEMRVLLVFIAPVTQEF